MVCDLFDDETGEPVEVSPRRILQRQVERAAAGRLRGDDRVRARVLPLPRDLRGSGGEAATPTSTPQSTTSSRTTTSSRRRRTSTSSARSATAWTARASRSSSRRARPGRASTRSTSLTPTRSRWPTATSIYKNGAKEIAAKHGQSDHLHGQVRHRPRSARRATSTQSLWPTGGNDSAMARREQTQRPQRRRPVVARRLDGRTRASLRWCFAPYVNSYKRYQPESWAPTAVAWGLDNRTLRLPGRRPRRRRPGRVAASPAPTPTPTSRSRRRSRPASTASSTDLEPRRSLRRERATPPPTSRGCRRHSRRRDRPVRGLRAGAKGVRRRRPRPSAQHREAGVGWFNRHVTDWELRRGFERL